MTPRLYIIISGFIFALAGLLHLIRIFYQWPATVGTLTIPVSLSFVAVILATVLAVYAFRLSQPFSPV